MTKADETILRKGRGSQWIAAGVTTGRASLVGALKQLLAAGATLADLCLAATPEAAHSLVTAPDGHDLDPLRSLVRGSVETRLPGYDFAILASPGCFANPLLLLEILDKVSAHIADGNVMLGVSVKSPAELATTARILLRHGSHHVHMRELPPAPVEPAIA